MPQAGRRGRPAGSRGRPGALAGEAGVSRGELRRQPPARGEAAAPAGLAQGDAAKPPRRSRGGREGGVGRDTFRARANCPRETLPGKRSSIRIGNARPGQQRDSPFSRRAPRKRLLRAHPTVAATRLWKRGGGWGGGSPRRPGGLGDFTPRRSSLVPGGGVFGCLLRRTQKLLRGVESEWRVGSKAKASRLQSSARSPSPRSWMHPALPTGLPTLRADSAARPASAFPFVAMSSDRCPVKKRGREVSSPTPTPSIK